MSLVAIRTPDQEHQARQAEQQRQAPYRPDPMVNFLSHHVKSCWETAKSARMPLTRRLLDCHRRRRGIYAPDKLAMIRQARGSEIWMGITGAKCRAAKAWLSDLFNADRPFSIDPTPIPDLPPEIGQRLVQEAVNGAIELGVPPEAVQELVKKHRDRLMDEMKQEADKRAGRMEEKIEDIMAETGWRKEFRDFIDDLVTYPFACLKGLEFSRQKTLVWAQGQDGKWTPQPGQKILPRARRASPFRVYPSPSATHTLNGHWVIEHQTFTRQDLANMRNAPGYNTEALGNVLAEYGVGGLKHWVWTDSELADLNGMSAHWVSKGDEIDGLSWSGTMSGRTLLDNGIPPTVVQDEFEEYQISILVIGNFVVQALVSPDPAGKPDYHFANWETVPGSIVGIALPEKLKDCQDMCNASARALADNMGMASGPMVGLFMDEIAPGSDATNLHPRKIFYFKDRKSGNSFPINFFQPQSNASELLKIYEKFDAYGDDITGLPRYAYGSDEGAGAAKTASGLSMLLSAASKNIKDIVRDIDDVVGGIVEKFYNFVMLTDKDDTVKGDASVKARGSEELMHKEQAQMRQQELLGITNNPVDLSIIGRDGRAEMLREVFKTGNIPEERIIPSREEIAQQELAAQQQAAMQAQQGSPEQRPPQQPGGGR